MQTKSNTTIAGERTQYTPGPWQSTEYGINEAKAKYLCIKKGGKTIARIDPQGNSLSTNKQDEANARLIAAAPELLEALKLCARELQGMHSHYHPTCEGGCPFDEANQKARAAIAKAESNLTD